MKQRECRPAERNNQSGNGSSTVQSAGEAGKKKANKSRQGASLEAPCLPCFRIGLGYGSISSPY
jgi:hypothetical protein